MSLIPNISNFSTLHSWNTQLVLTTFYRTLNDVSCSVMMSHPTSEELDINEIFPIAGSVINPVSSHPQASFLSHFYSSNQSRHPFVSGSPGKIKQGESTRDISGLARLVVYYRLTSYIISSPHTSHITFEAERSTWHIDIRVCVSLQYILLQKYRMC